MRRSAFISRWPQLLAGLAVLVAIGVALLWVYSPDKATPNSNVVADASFATAAVDLANQTFHRTYRVDWIRHSVGVDRVVDERGLVVFTARRQCALGRLCPGRPGTVAHLSDTAGGPDEFVIHDDRTDQLTMYGALAGRE